MNKNIENIKFTLTPNMSLELIKFNDLKNKYDKLKEAYDSKKDNKTLIELTKLEKQMNDCKSRFVNEFKISNKKQINEYLQTK